jgi:hypothetical protein
MTGAQQEDFDELRAKMIKNRHRLQSSRSTLKELISRLESTNRGLGTSEKGLTRTAGHSR